MLSELTKNYKGLVSEGAGCSMLRFTSDKLKGGSNFESKVCHKTIFEVHLGNWCGDNIVMGIQM